MKTQIATTGFDYSPLEKEAASKLQYYATAGRGLVRKTQIRFIAEFGKILSEARGLLANHRSGTFGKWAEAEFDLSKQTAYNYVNAWEKILSNGWTIYDNVSPTALYLLSHDDTPKSVRDKALQLAKKQPVVTKADVDLLLNSGAPERGGRLKLTAPEPPPDSDPFDDDEDPFEAPESPETASEPETESEPPRPPKRRQRAAVDAEGASPGKPQKQFPRSHWFKQWEQGIGPLVRLVDRIAEEVREKHDPHHEAAQEFLEKATEEMAEWMRVRP